MSTTLRSFCGTATLMAVLALPAQAQAPAGIVPDLITDITQLEGKMMDLARAIPEASYGWRPGEGVRSVAEVFQHVAADNYLLPGIMGTAPPAATGIDPASYATVQQYETRKLSRVEVIADLERSFAHLKQAISATAPGTMGDELGAFGQTFTRQQMLVLTTTHLHEHLGQAIAYARINGIVPPWSRSGN